MTARRRRDLQRGEDVWDGRRHAQPPEHAPAARGVGLHQLDRPRVDPVQSAQGVDRDREERDIRGEDRDGLPTVDPFEPSPTTTIGATARIGTVCEATMYGRISRSSRRDCESATASTKPIAAPSRKPASASLPGEPGCMQQCTTSGGPPVALGCPNAANDVVQVRHRPVVDGERPRPSRSPPRATCSPPRAPRARRRPAARLRLDVRLRRRGSRMGRPARLRSRVCDYHNANCVVSSPRAARPLTHRRRAS